jgi:two-component system chemotaxis response regulator CheB
MIGVMVVDDSALMRKIISDIINDEENMQVIGTAKDGEEFLDKLESLKPDVITLDVEMPKMNGISALKKMKRMKIDIPVIVLSSPSGSDAITTMECLESGAFDFIPKPSGQISLDLYKVKYEIIEKINLAFEQKMRGQKKSEAPKEVRVEEKSEKMPIPARVEALVIGASTGGPKAIFKIITKLPEDLGIPVFIVQHMPEGFTKAFAERLNLNSCLKVQEASHMESIEENNVYIAPGGSHMEIGNDRRIYLNKEPAIWGVRPAADKLFSSASEVYGSGLMSIVLTGMGKDGSKGTVDVKNKGGLTISEDRSTCVIYGMPKSALETGKIDSVLPLDKIADEIIKQIRKSRG